MVETDIKTSARYRLKESFSRRRASLSEAEKSFLHALLVDDNDTDDSAFQLATNVLNDDILFSLPTKPKDDFGIDPPLPRKARRPSTLGLWQAHSEGVHPRQLAGRGSLVFETPKTISEVVGIMKKQDEQEKIEDDKSTCSDHEVRKDDKCENGSSDGSSWNEADHKDHYDSWEVLKSEYAEEFGCDYKEKIASVEEILAGEDRNSFLILGTSVDDSSAQPHVLSPPLMDSLMSHLPQALRSTNYWLKYSLVRDGARLETLIRHCRASPATVLAIETKQGEVFGSFTSSPWHIYRSYFGGPPSFAWKMRYSRKTPCASLFDQAQLESQVDVYPFKNSDELIQVCSHAHLGVGGDSNKSSSSKLDGFAFSLNSDLLKGITCPCSSFDSPSLCGPVPTDACTFEVMNIEVWTLTSCRDVATAEHLEMSQFFRRESTQSLASESSHQFSSSELLQDKFYQRVGQDIESEERRQRWAYANMMDGDIGNSSSVGMGASPRFGYS